MKKWIVILVVVSVGAYLAYRKWPDLLKPKTSDAAAGVSSRPTTAVVETRNISFKITAAGDIGPSEQVSVRPEVNGKINHLPVDIGDQVKKDQILFTLDDTDLQIERSQRVTEIEGSKLQVAKAERNYLRSKELFEEALISKELYEDTKTEFELAKNSLDRAQKALGLIEDRLKKTKIVAPFDCTILTRPVSIGQAVSGSGGFNSGTEVLTIADLNQMIINAHINQADVTRLSAGQKVDVQIESVPGLTMVGTVERVAPQSTIRNSIKGYAARIRIGDIDPRVRPGMTANLSIPIASADNALAVPLAAIFSEQGERFAYVKNGDTFEKRPVQLGIADYDFAEVQSGLQEGDVVSLEDKGNRTAQNAFGKPAGMAGGGARPAGGPVGTPATGGTNRIRQGSGSGTAVRGAERSRSTTAIDPGSRQTIAREGNRLASASGTVVK